MEVYKIKVMNITKKIIFLFCLSSFIVSANSNQDGLLSKKLDEMVDLDLPFYASEYNAENLTEKVGKYNIIKDNNRYSVKVIVSFDTTNENLVNMSVSRNYFQITEVSQNKLEEAIITSLSGDDDENNGMSPHASCIESCKDKYTDDEDNKISGRGACKANCWVDTGVKLVAALSPF